MVEKFGIANKLILAFVTLIVGVILIGTIASQTNAKTTETGVSGETISISTALNSITENTVNETHGTYFDDSAGKRGTYILPTVTENNGKDLACTQPVVSNATSGQVIAVGNWSWAFATQARGRCGIVINASSFPDPIFNNSLWNFTYTVTYKYVNSSVTLSIAQIPTGWKANDCPINTIVLTNGTTTITQNTDYTYSAGNINLLGSLINNLTSGTSYKATYDYCADDYLNSSWGRTTLNLIAGFFALALLIISVGLFYSVAQDTGMI